MLHEYITNLITRLSTEKKKARFRFFFVFILIDC
jgi:hypothetical protein